MRFAIGLLLALLGSSAFADDYTPVGPQQAGTALTSSTALVIPQQSGGPQVNYASVCVRGGNANYTTDGKTTPNGTSTSGKQLLQNACVTIVGVQTVNNFRAIQQSGNTTTLDADFYVWRSTP